jgi:hypothetical protein
MFYLKKKPAALLAVTIPGHFLAEILPWVNPSAGFPGA